MYPQVYCHNTNKINRQYINGAKPLIIEMICGFYLTLYQYVTRQELVEEASITAMSYESLRGGFYISQPRSEVRSLLLPRHCMEIITDLFMTQMNHIGLIFNLQLHSSQYIRS